MEIEDCNATDSVKYIIKNPMDMFTKQRLWDAFEETHLLLMEVRDFCESKAKNEVVTRDDIIKIIDSGLE